MTKLGVYAGGLPLTNEFSAWLGRPVDVAEWFCQPTNQGPSSGWQGSGYQLVVCPYMKPPLSQGATGAFDSMYATLAAQLVAIGHGNAIIRVGWEYNASWMDWRAAADPISYRKFWRNIVRAMRAVPGAAFKFDWCAMLGKLEMADPTQAYPGDEYVDYVGVDVYDTASGDTLAERTAAWKVKANGPQGLDYWEAFAALHGKRLSVPEWGLVVPSVYGGGGDDVLFVEKMEKWVTTHDVAYHCYFNTTAPGGLGDHRISPNATFPAPTPYPLAAARYRQLFGA